MNENKDNISKLMGWAKAELRGKFIAVIAYIKKDKRSQTKNIIFQLKTLKIDQTKPKSSKAKEIIKLEETL